MLNFVCLDRRAWTILFKKKLKSVHVVARGNIFLPKIQDIILERGKARINVTS